MGDFAAHLRHHVGYDAGFRSDIAHVIFARWHDARDQQGLVTSALQSLRKPNHMTRGSTDIETSNDAENLHQILDLRFWICDFRSVMFSDEIKNRKSEIQNITDRPCEIWCRRRPRAGSRPRVRGVPRLHRADLGN